MLKSPHAGNSTGRGRGPAGGAGDGQSWSSTRSRSSCSSPCVLALHSLPLPWTLEEVQPAGRQLPLLRRVEPAVRDPAVDLHGRRLVRGAGSGARPTRPRRAPRLDAAVGRRQPRHARLLQVRQVPARQLQRADGAARRRVPRRRTSTSCCRSASRSIRSRRCPTRSTCTCGARRRRGTSSTTRCSSRSSRIWSPDRSCARPSSCRSSPSRAVPARGSCASGWR